MDLPEGSVFSSRRDHGQSEGGEEDGNNDSPAQEAVEQGALTKGISSSNQKMSSSDFYGGASLSFGVILDLNTDEMETGR